MPSIIQRYKKFDAMPTDVEVIRLVPSRLAVGIACVIVAAIPLIITPHVQPRLISILCGDIDARYPLRKTTVPAWLVFVVGYVTAFFIFLGMGLVAQYHFSYIQPGRRPRVYHIRKHAIPRALVDLLRGYATFVFGTFLTLSITEIVKIMVGRPRPDFWAVCRPVFIVNGTRVDKCIPGEFIDLYECQNPAAHDTRDSRLSFLSGHTSFSFYCATYLACYLERKFRPVQLPCLRLLLQVILLFLALLVGLSRIVDNQHHWSDVLAGAILGLIIGYYTEQLIKADLFGRGKVVPGAGGDDADQEAAVVAADRRDPGNYVMQGANGTNGYNGYGAGDVSTYQQQQADGTRHSGNGHRRRSPNSNHLVYGEAGQVNPTFSKSPPPIGIVNGAAATTSFPQQQPQPLRVSHVDETRRRFT